MASSYTSNAAIEKPGAGEQAGTWGTTTNLNFDIIDRALSGVVDLTITGSRNLETTDGTLSDGGYKVLVLSGTPGSAFTITILSNSRQKVYLVKNGTGQTATFTQGSGGDATVEDGETAWIWADGGGATAQVQKGSFSVVNDTSPSLGGNLDTNAKNINFGDSSGASDDRLNFGAGTDLSIYHDGSDSHIAESGTGSLKISGSQVNIEGTGETLATFVDNGAATLYYDDTATIATTSVGVDVTGTVQGDSFTLDNGSNDWTFTVVSNKLTISYSGTAKMELDTSGNLKVTGNITAFDTI